MRYGAAALLALSLSIGAALAGPEAAELPDALAAGWHGEKVCELLSQNAERRVLKCTFAPGKGHERHFHPPNFGYALSGGRMRIKDSGGTREVDIATGSHFESAGTAWHEAVNIGPTTVSYLIVENLSKTATLR